jgi:hypothetical protein
MHGRQCAAERQVEERAAMQQCCEPPLHAESVACIPRGIQWCEHAADWSHCGNDRQCSAVQTGASSSCGRKWPSCGAPQRTSTRLGCALSSQVAMPHEHCDYLLARLELPPLALGQ